MQTNEELLQQAKEGNEDAILELWHQARKIVFSAVKRWGREANGLTKEDLAQESFIGFLNAVKGFDSSSGKQFSTYVMNAVRWRLQTVMGYHSEKTKREPLRDCVSLDTPLLDDEDGGTLLDMLEDPAAAEAFNHADSFGALEPFLSALPEKQQAALFLRYWLEIPLSKEERKLHDTALRTLRHPDRSRKLKELWMA